MFKYIFILVLFLVSCSSGKTDLHGKWVLKNIDYTEFQESIPEDKRESFTREINNQLSQILDKTVFDFQKDKKFELETIDVNGKMKIFKGTYYMSDKQDSLYLEMDFPESYKIVKLTKEDLILHTSEAPTRTVTLKYKD